MTIGEYLKKLITDKDIPLRQLSEMMGVQSRTELYRLFNDYHSEKKMRALVNKLIECVDFTEEEMDKIHKLMSQKKVSKFYGMTRKALSLVYSGIDIKDFPENDKMYDMLKQCDNKDAVLYIANIDEPIVLQYICEYLDKNPKSQAYHYIRINNRKVYTAHDLAMLIILSRYKNYVPIILDDISFKGILALTKKHGEYGICQTEEINGERLYINTQITQKLYEYCRNRQECFNRMSQPVKEPVKSVVNYIDLMTKSAAFEQGTTFYSEGSPCFGNIPCDIIYDMLRDINYLGFPENHPYVENMLNLYKTRQELLMNTPGARKMYLFDEHHIKHMMQTGISFDHAEMFKPMKKEQLRRYFNWLIEMARDRPDKIQFRFLKNGRIDYPYVYGKDIMLYMFCSDTGYMNGFSTMIDNKGIFDIMNDFTQYVWEEFTMSDEDSIARLGHMMDEYIK